MFVRIASLIGLLGVLVAGESVAEDFLNKTIAADFYCPEHEVSGDLELTGSTTMQQVAALWADGFQRIHPQVNISIDTRGSETALEAIATDHAVIGLMSRPILDDERKRALEDPDARLVELVVCHDALGLIVHRENPVAGVRLGTKGQLLRLDDSSIATTWGDLGLNGDWSDLPITLHAPTKQSGTRSFVNRLLPEGDDTRPKIAEHANHDKLIQAVAADRGSLGLVSLSRCDLASVRLVPAGRTGETFVEPTPESIRTRQYPLLRALSVLVVVPGETLEQPSHREFVAYLLSRSGQQDVLKDGFLPLSRPELNAQEDKLGWNRLH